MEEKFCEERYKTISERLKGHDTRLEDHEKKIDCLEKSDATNTNEIKHLCQQIGSQTQAIWGLVISIAGVGISFVIWYIQTIGGR